MAKTETDVAAASAALKKALAAARAAGFRVKFDVDADGDPVAVLDGGPEPKEEAKPAAEKQA